MILKTDTPQDFYEGCALLIGKGYTPITNALPINHKGENYLLIDHPCALFALTTQARADKDGYTNYQDSQFIKNLKK